MAAEFCGNCGAKFPPSANWCAECGAKREPGSQSGPANQNPTGTSTVQRQRTNWPLITAGLVAVLAIGAATVSGVFSATNERTRVAVDPADKGSPEQVTPEDPSPLEKLENYEDRFLSDADTTLFVKQSANVRDFPTPAGSKVIGSLSAGESVSGRWVRGVTPNTRWLRFSGNTGASYVWEGALTTERPFSIEDYRDTYLSAQVQTLVATGPANVRSFPGPDVGKVYYQLSEGDIISGRWVRGIDPEERYLKIVTRRGPAYVWEDNLS